MRRRNWVILGIVVLVLGVSSWVLEPVLPDVWARMQPDPSAADRAKAVAAVEAQAHQAYGSLLETVTVTYERDPAPAYSGRIRLVSSPVRLGFHVSSSDLLHYGAGDSGLPGIEFLHPSLFGGADSVLRLVTSVQSDSPQSSEVFATSVKNWLDWYGSSQAQELLTPYRSTGWVLFPSKAAAVDGFAATAVYALDPSSQEWRRVHVGPLAKE